MKTSLEDIRIMEVPKIADTRGNLSVIEKDTIPFKINRVYYLYDVPSDAYRGGHAHKEQLEFLIAVSGSFDVILNDGMGSRRVTLNKPNKGLLIPIGIWRELDNFSSGAVCLVLASDVFEEGDYIRDFDDFLKSKEV
ncbi:FdtA/QdtA family cupin domain-containing protein [Mangrovimonas sp. AS39]|uniref:sugar 3,4-ketoisomerase n=1 Tax=Mangrovimonas futianensis TaxID=2895523 RepID=UPI001E5E8F5B|nr:FdtA/QdtA family cupin domain-containing protein [Mangrovimonas futianensis]MCF1191411.1 FdtA/QdtA family cupin domain-containing protein [Mangrovimonas futianensis]MCF1195106.1 FdtA/QdtA family cupin domain-containing protein [Mangrovimonas futianensis]